MDALVGNFGVRKATGQRYWFLLGHAVQSEVGAELGEAGAYLEIHLEEELGFHVAEVLIAEGFANTLAVTAELLELFLVGRNVLFLQFLETGGFKDGDGLPVVVVPPPNSGLGNVQVSGDFGNAPALDAQERELMFFFNSMHDLSVVRCLLSVFVGSCLTVTGDA